jgi:hypothetical protein
LGGEVRAGRREGLWVVARRKCGYVHGKGPTQDLGARACAERTVNMLSHLLVTLEVSQLSGWLKAYAFCPAEREGHAMRGEARAGRREGVGWWWRERRARGQGPTQGLGGRARAERTVNTSVMSVTLDVSKFTGWLKACACCRVERTSMRCGARCVPGGGRAWGGGGASGVHGKKARLKAWGPGHARSARRTCGLSP